MTTVRQSLCKVY